jgi:hypothetical protein
MSRSRIACFMLLLGTSLLAAGVAQAQVRNAPPRKPREDADLARLHAAQQAALEIWLGRLTGRFEVSRRGWSMGTEDCVQVGQGVGVHCVRGPPPITLQTVVAPTMILYGLDRNAPGIRYLQVNGRSIAEGDLGRLSGDTVTFPKVPCPKFVDQRPKVFIMTCERRLRIYAPPDGKSIRLQYLTEQLVVVPTPPNGRRPPGQILTELIEISDSFEMQRVPADPPADAR